MVATGGRVADVAEDNKLRLRYKKYIVCEICGRTFIRQSIEWEWCEHCGERFRELRDTWDPMWYAEKEWKAKRRGCFDARSDCV